MDTKKLDTSKNNREHEHCTHPSLIRDFVAGAPTGDLICAQCQRLLSSIIRTAR